MVYFQVIMSTLFLLALSIHISNTTNEILEKLGGFQTEERGEITVKV